jgi:CPA1 family monovalent cation:H+ antiporter
LTALFAWLNHITLRLPVTIGLLLMGLIASLLLMALRLLFPDLTIFHEVTRLLREIDFSQALLNGFLAFLLFAGALHVDVSRLRDRKWIIGMMASLGLLISTIVVATGFWMASAWLGCRCRLPGRLSSALSSVPPIR